MAVFVLGATGPSDWTTYVVVGAVVAAVGALLFPLFGPGNGLSEPAKGLTPILSAVLVLLGLGAIAGGFGLRAWEHCQPEPLDVVAGQ
jgi:sulfite exporter TauE/SafE